MMDTPMSFVNPLLFRGSGAGSLESLGFCYCCSGGGSYGIVGVAMIFHRNRFFPFLFFELIESY